MAKVVVSPSVLQALEAVRVSGVTNMLNRRMVQRAADALGFPDAVVWLEEVERAEYVRGISEGFTTEESDDAPSE